MYSYNVCFGSNLNILLLLLVSCGQLTVCRQEIHFVVVLCVNLIFLSLLRQSPHLCGPVFTINIPLIVPLTKCLMTSSPDLITSISLDLYQSAGKSEFKFDWIGLIYFFLTKFFLV